MTDYLIPMILLLASALSLGKKENSYSLLLEGGAEGLRLLKDILPTLVLLLTAVELFRSSGYCFARAFIDSIICCVTLTVADNPVFGS